MRHCLVAAGSNALRRAANAATRGDSIIRLDKSSVSLARRIEVPLKLMYVRALSRGRAGKLEASVLELRAALQSGLDHALVEVGEADLEECQLGQRR